MYIQFRLVFYKVFCWYWPRVYSPQVVLKGQIRFSSIVTLRLKKLFLHIFVFVWVFLWLHYCVSPVRHYNYVVYLRPAEISRLFPAREVFKLAISPGMSDIILQKTNSKYINVWCFNRLLTHTYRNVFLLLPRKTLELFTDIEFDVFCSILITASANRSVLCISSVCNER